MVRFDTDGKSRQIVAAYLYSRVGVWRPRAGFVKNRLNLIVSQPKIIWNLPIGGGHSEAGSVRAGTEYQSFIWIANLDGSCLICDSLAIRIKRHQSEMERLSGLVHSFVRRQHDRREAIYIQLAARFRRYV